MSTCISNDGEFSEHRFDADPDVDGDLYQWMRWTCCRCQEFDTEGLIDALVAAEAKVASVEALKDAEIADEIERRVRAARADVRCLDCNMRYEERQEYGCHVPGHGHDYDEGDFAGAEEIERASTVEYVTLSVSDLRAALAKESS